MTITMFCFSFRLQHRMATTRHHDRARRFLLACLATAIFASHAAAAANNRPPHFLPGGDMARFSIAEDTPVGKSVYKLTAVDPDGSAVSYTISGQHLSVDRSTGVVTLIKGLDRETLDSLEVVISVTGNYRAPSQR